jgi:thiosulfate reductase cytochrome b subunit
MAGSAYFPGMALRSADISRHSPVVRITHWINTLSFFGLLVSGFAILLAHPRLYWGETGNVGTPSLIDLPLPFVLTGQTGWGRSLHFLSAWACVANGSLYVISGLVTRNFRRTYNVPQGLTYLLVIAVLFPLMIWTGLAMSPAITSVFPALVTGFGGQQSARTIHFFAAGSLVVFLIVHVAMVWRAGFRKHVQAMIIGKDRI